MKLLKAIFPCAAALLLTLSAGAETLPLLDPERPCSLTVSLTQGDDNETPEANAGITLYRAADLVLTDNGFTFAYAGEFADCTYNLSNYLSPELASSLVFYAHKNGCTGTTARTDAKGEAVFSDLTVGLYLVEESDTPEGFDPFTPFLTVLPVTEEGKMVYDVYAAPKVESFAYSSLIVHKIWNDDRTVHPEIEVELLRNGEVYRTVTLSEENNWYYGWSRLNKEDTWSVREINIPDGYVVSYGEDIYGFVIRNTPPTLVQTGQTKWPVPVLGGGGLLLIVLGTLLCAAGKKRKDSDHA